MLWKKKNVLLSILIMFAAFVSLAGFTFNSSNQGFARVDTDHFMQMMKHKNFTLIDVHIPYQGEIPGTDAFLPYDRLADFANRLPQDKSAPIVVYCMGNEMGRIAAQTLVRMGHTNVTQYDEGMIGWRNAGGKLIYRPKRS